MDKQLCACTLLLCAGVAVWFVVNLQWRAIDYERHTQLVDPKTGATINPRDLMELTKVINQTDQYIESTSAYERLYDLTYNMNFENPFLIDQDYSDRDQLLVSGWPVASQSKCGEDLQWILGQLEEHKNYTFLRGRRGYELTNLMDSFGRPESSLFTGTVTWLGSYKQCVDKLHLNGGRLKTRYCLARMRPKWWPKNETIMPRTTIRLGTCLPESCDSLSFHHHKNLIERLAKHQLPEFYQRGLDFESLFCLPDERSPIRQVPLSGRIFVQTVSFWLALIVTGTIIHEVWQARERRFQRDEEFFKKSGTSDANNGLSSDCKQIELINSNSQSCLTKDIVRALSIRSAIKAFKTNSFRVRYAQGERTRVDLGCLNSLKILMALTVVLGHSCYLASLYSRNLSNRIDINTNNLGRMALSVSRCVDFFFFVFGVLTTYTLMRKFSSKQLSNPLIWLGINAAVLLRISPVFMLVYWYSKSISPYTGMGPWWDYGVHKHSMRGVCMRDPWWKSIPYFGSVGTPPVPACVLPGWFIVSYSQISMLLPLITYILCKLPNYWLRYTLISFLTLTSSLSIGMKLYTQKVLPVEGFSLYGSFLSDLLEKFESSGFMSTLGRLGSVSIGCLVGYILRQYEIGHISQWPRWIINRLIFSVVLVLHLVIIFAPIIGNEICQRTKRLATLEEFTLFNSTVIVMFPILNSILLINIVTVLNHKAPIRFFGHAFWHVFNRLGLSIYLVHWEIIFVVTTSFEQAPTHGFVTDIMKNWAFGAFLSIIIAFLIYILLEAPLTALLAILSRFLTQKHSFHDGTRAAMSASGEYAADPSSCHAISPTKC